VVEESDSLPTTALDFTKFKEILEKLDLDFVLELSQNLPHNHQRQLWHILHHHLCGRRARWLLPVQGDIHQCPNIPHGILDYDSTSTLGSSSCEWPPETATAMCILFENPIVDDDGFVLFPLPPAWGPSFEILQSLQ
jgi:hypothetical protein